MAGSAIAEVSTYSASVVGPDAGDSVTAASVRVMGASLANRTKYLNDGKFASVTAGRVVSSPWTVFNTSDVPILINYGPLVAVGDYAHVPINLPHGATFNSFTVGLDPGVHALLPAVMPAFHVFRITAATGQIDNTGGGPWGGFDPSASTAVFNATHDVTFNVGIVADRTTDYYFLRFIQESGANSIAGLLFNARVNVTTAQQDPVGIV